MHRDEVENVDPGSTGENLFSLWRTLNGVGTQIQPGPDAIDATFLGNTQFGGVFQVIPEPTTGWLVIVGGFLLVRRRR